MAKRKRLKKGSAEAKRHMAKLRDLRGKKPKVNRGEAKFEDAPPTFPNRFLTG